MWKFYYFIRTLLKISSLCAFFLNLTPHMMGLALIRLYVYKYMNFNWLIKSENLCEYNKKEWEKNYDTAEIHHEPKVPKLNTFYLFFSRAQPCHNQWWWFKKCFLFLSHSLAQVSFKYHYYVHIVVITTSLPTIFTSPNKKPKVSSTKISLFLYII